MKWQEYTPQFHIQETWIVCPTDDRYELKCYMLLDEHNWVFIGGHVFGFIGTMNMTDHSSSDCRYLMIMRGSPEWTWANDMPKVVQP